ncbi:DUF551 domain-containing protein [Azospirillum sp.]|uniref:DUF551 domain-containing protein n=1 Tax=Azospirillum sp. TaxID=34012 RepID=UPI002D3A0734|nr:DUF551 domain-containing protein [Azospirillum sp.]HYF89017.1 DUF551 domain-containing protein [Azospirillum sp.]
MAKSDYICCDRCDCKIVYDHDDRIMEGLVALGLDKAPALCETCRAATAPAPAAVPIWQPIETAPEDGTRIDVWSKLDERVTGAKWHKDAWRYWGIDGFESWAWVKVDGEVTHWMPLPPAPSASPAASTEALTTCVTCQGFGSRAHPDDPHPLPCPDCDGSGSVGTEALTETAKRIAWEMRYRFCVNYGHCGDAESMWGDMISPDRDACLAAARAAPPAAESVDEGRRILEEMTALFEMGDEANTPGTDSYTILWQAREFLRGRGRGEG